MIVAGRVLNGVVVIENGTALPEGASVNISYVAPKAVAAPIDKRRIQVPLVRSDRPVSIRLTGERIAAILDEEDASS